MKPGERHFTIDVACIGDAGRQHQLRERVGEGAGVYFAQAAEYLKSAPEDYRTSHVTFHTMGLGALTSWHEADILFEGNASRVSPFSSSPHPVDRRVVAVSHPFDIFTEESTGVRFVCGALVGSSNDEQLSTLIVAVPRPLEVPDAAPLTDHELKVSTPLALIRQDIASCIRVFPVDSVERTDSGASIIRVTPLSDDSTATFVSAELPRLIAAMPIADSV